MTIRFSSAKVGVAYVALGVVALALFAAPLWYGWRANLGTFRSYVPAEQMQALVDLFHREGAPAVASAMAAQAKDTPPDEVVLFASPSKEVLAGNLSAWPPEVPDAAGTYGLVIGLGERASMRVVASHVTLPGGYHLLMGRESVRFESLVERFWYGIAVAVAIVLGLGAVLARLLRRIEIEQLVEERTGALRRSEERYAIALSSGEEGFWDWDLATDAYHASPRLLEMCGFPRDSTFANRAEFLARFPFAPGEREKWVAGVEAHFAGTSDRMDREVAILRDGETRWLQTSGLATRGASGAVVRWTGAMRDITERRRAEEALRLSEQRYARAMDAAEAGHWEWNVATDEMFVSARQREMLEIPLELQFARREDYLARIPLHPEDRERYIATARRHIAEAWPRFEQEFRVILKSGELRWMRLTGKSHRNAEGRPTHFTGSLIDITERKLAADALRASEERYSLAMEASQEGHFDADLDTDQLYISERLNEIYGFAPGTQFASRTEYLRSFQFHADDGERYLAALKAVEAKGGPERYEFEYRIVRASGEIRWLRTRGKVIRDAEGRARRRSGVVTDITERKLAADALRESEGRYARAMEATEAGHWEWDLVTHQVFHSPRFRELYGIGLDETFADRETWKARQPLGPSERERQERALQEAIADPAKNYDIELSFELRPGEVRWLRSRGKVFRNEHGRPLRVTGATTDITARKLAEDGLRASEERYALAMEAAGDGHIDWNLVTGEFYISPRLLRILGYPPGTTFADRADWVRRFPFHPEDRPRWEAAIAAHFAGREATFRMDLRIVVKGETRWVAFTFIATRDPAGKPVRWTGSIADINDAKLAEEALRESQERYALAVAGSDDGVWDCDFAARRVFISARARELAGMPPGPEIVPMDEWFARLPLHPEDVAPRTAALQAHLSGKTPAYVGEFRLRQPDGRYHWRRLHGLCLRDAHGEPLRMAGSISDIDDRRRAEEGLRLSEERYALALEASEEGHFDIDLETDEIFVSARVNDIYGFPRQARIANRTEFLNQIPFHPDDRHLLADIISSDWDDPARVKRLERYTLRIVPRPGETRWIQTNAMVTRDAQGRARRRVGVIADITERKLAEEARRLSEERYALAMEASEEGHFDWNVRTDEIFASTHLKKLLDLPEDQQFPTRGDMIARVRYYPGDRAHLEQITREVLASGALQNEFEYRLLRGPAGETRWIRARWKILRDADGAAERVIGVVSDITERKLAVEALLARETRFRSLTELSADWYWKQDENLRFVHFSGSETPIGKTRWELPYTPLSCSWDEHRATLAARKPFRDFEYARVEDDGRVRYISVGGMPLFDENGRFRGYEGVARDITQRKRIEEELRSRQEMLQLAQKAARAVPWEWRNGVEPALNRWSPELEAMFGLPPGAYDGTVEAWRKLVHPEDWGRVKSSMQHALETGEVDVEYRVLHPDGKVRWLNQKGRAFFDAEGKPLRSIGFMFDVTERRKVEDDLRSRQEMLELAQKSARAIAFEWRMGAGEGENRWSPDLEAMYGFAPGTYDGSFEMWRKLVHPEDWPTVKEAIRHALSTGEVASEYRVIHLDGSVHWLQAKGRVFSDRLGKPARMVGFMQDVTQRKEAEDEVRKLELELRRAQRLEAMGTMAGGIAHDFNNILGAILGYGEMAMRDAKAGTRLRRDLDSIMAAGERGRSLVDRILAFSRSGVGERMPVHVEEVVREALDQLAANLPENVTIAPRLRGGRAAMLGDSTQVHQVVMNLTSNAVQAMPQGGVLRVTLETVRFEAPRPATVGSLAAGDYIVVRIADSGSGIPDDVLERMFDPFFTTKEVGVGSGLGLSLVHGIVTNVGGAIDVATELGKGSTFTVFLPRSGDAPAKAPDENRPLPRGEGQRVLVVDDEEPLVRLATETLERLGYAPVGFTSSTAALAAFRADPQQFDAVLTDERMPGLSGTALIREMRGIRDAIPVVLMSGYLGMEATGIAPRTDVGVGADVVVKKPLSARDLAASMARVLQD